MSEPEISSERRLELHQYTPLGRSFINHIGDDYAEFTEKWPKGTVINGVRVGGQWKPKDGSGGSGTGDTKPAGPARKVISTAPAKPMKVSGTPAEISKQFQDLLADENESWISDLRSGEAKPKTVEGFVREMTAKSSPSMYINTARDGYLTDGRIAVAIPAAQQSKVPPPAPDESAGFRSKADAIKKMLAEAPMASELHPIGSAYHGGRLYHLVDDGNGNRAAAIAENLATISKMYPGATFHFTKNYRGTPDFKSPLIARANGKAVAVLMPLHTSKRTNFNNVSVHDRTPVERFVEALQPNEPAGDSTSTGIIITKPKQIKGAVKGRKAFAIVRPFVGSLTISQGSDGWRIEGIQTHDSGHSNGSTTEMSKEQAVADAKQILRYAHGTAKHGLIFKPREG